MTIKDAICKKLVVGHEIVLKRFEEIGAPDVILSREKEIIENAKKQNSGYKSEVELLDCEYIDSKTLKGKGGKQYLSINDGTINFFTATKYGGMCIYSNKQKGKSTKKTTAPKSTKDFSNLIRFI